MPVKCLAALLALSLAPSFANAADVIVISGDPPGVGFNDPTPAAPVGGNPGTTVGQQALNAFQEAADRWGARLVSRQPILVVAFFTPLSCTATTGVLGSAGALWSFANVPGANGGKDLPPNTWYPAALAEKITRQDIVADPNLPFEIFAFFNSKLGTPGCLTSSGWYYGLDDNEPATLIDLVAVVLHEFGHGLGFSVGPTDAETGERPLGYPSVWESNMLDLATGKRWLDMTDAERAASALDTNNLVWAGKKAANGVHSTLDFGKELRGLDPSSIGSHEIGTATFGPPLSAHDRGYVIAPADGGGASLYDGCEPFPATNGIAGNFVLMNRGTCTFVQKALNAQNAGASAAIIANNAPGPLYPGGTSSAVTIPTVGITQALGAALSSLQLPYVDLLLNPLRRDGTTLNFPRLYAPAVFAGGSSVSHWDTTLTPNMLMEPFINSDVGTSVKNPDDLTKQLLTDIGW